MTCEHFYYMSEPILLSTNTPLSLHCDNLDKTFGGVKALAKVSLSLPRKGIVAIIGPNGAGKSTLLNAWTGFVRPDDGRCVVDNKEITWLPPYKIARHGIARTFQDMRLIRQMSVLENVMLARPKQRGERLWAALIRICYKSEESRNREQACEILRFVGLAEKAHELAGELSYGQQKLLAFACCLATEAHILLLDEPIAGVHPEMAERILGLMKQLGEQSKLIVFIEHDISAVKRSADHIIVMDAGRVIAAGSPSDVLERPEILEAYVG